MFHLIVNENNLVKKNLRKLKLITDVFDRAKKEYTVHRTTHAGHTLELARELFAENKGDTFVAVGGDGTLHEIINGIKDFSNSYVGLIPFGTGNDFAAAAGIPMDVRRAAEIIAFLPPRPIDYIELSSGLKSVNAVGMGIDVDVLKRAYSGKNKGKSKYFFALISSLIHFKSYDFTVRYEGKEEKHFGLIAALGNGKQFGGGIKVFPDAKLDDGYLDLIIVDYLSRWQTLTAFIKLMAGKINKVKNTTQIKVKSAEFIPLDGSFTIQAEGELYDGTPLCAHVVEKGIKFHLPVNND